MAGSTTLVKAIKLKEQENVTINWYVTNWLPEVCEAKKIMGLFLHQDNACSHTAQPTVKYLRKNKVTVFDHPPCSSNWAVLFWANQQPQKNTRMKLKNRLINFLSTSQRTSGIPFVEN